MVLLACVLFRGTVPYRREAVGHFGGESCEGIPGREYRAIVWVDLLRCGERQKQRVVPFDITTTLGV